VAVDFAPPRVSFGRAGRLLILQLGPTSRVGLDTTHLSVTLTLTLALALTLNLALTLTLTR
jgi:hypothetical protein